MADGRMNGSISNDHLKKRNDTIFSSSCKKWPWTSRTRETEHIESNDRIYPFLIRWCLEDIHEFGRITFTSFTSFMCIFLVSPISFNRLTFWCIFSPPISPLISPSIPRLFSLPLPISLFTTTFTFQPFSVSLTKAMRSKINNRTIIHISRFSVK